MSEHLPECPAYGVEKWAEVDECGPCNWIRTCGQRVWDEAYACGFNAGRDHGEKVGRAAGLDAAREAVERVSSLLQPLGPALAAIDALRGSGNPYTPPSAEKGEKP